MICYIAIDGSFKLGGCVAFQTSRFEMPETFNQCREVRMYGSVVNYEGTPNIHRLNISQSPSTIISSY
jgi:hypothetical protein